MNDRKVIGQGAYGCVHKPSLKCLEIPYPNFNYNEHISKFMSKKNAEKELEEFEIIKNIDTDHEFHLGLPIICNPNTIFSKEKEDIKKCKYFNQYDVMTNPSNYRLLIMKYGGSDLKQFCVYEINNYLSENTEYKIDMFWLNIHALIKGLNIFNKNGISHCDIKPANIVFDKETISFKYIDFGLMTTFKKLKELSIENKNILSVFHWTYPFETGLMNLENFNKYTSLSNEDKAQFAEEFRKSIILTEDFLTNYEPLSIDNLEGFKMLFSFLNENQQIPTVDKQCGYINSFLYGLNKIIENSNNYETVLEKIIISIDIFSLGFTLQYVLNNFMLTNKLSIDFYSSMSNLFNKMYNFNILNRLLDTEVILNDYETLLLELGILRRLNKNCVNNEIIDSIPISVSYKEKDIVLSSDKIDELMSKNAKELQMEIEGGFALKHNYRHKLLKNVRHTKQTTKNRHNKKHKTKKRRIY